MLKRVRLAALVVALTAPCAAVAQEKAPDEKVEVVGSLWCDTPDQLETVLKAHYTDKVPLGQAMADINRNNPEACIFARAIVNVGGEVRRMTAGDAVMSLRSARVHGIMRGQYALMMRPQTWFYVKIVAELVPL